MFEDSLFFSDSPSHHHRRWTPLVSFVAQAALVGAAIILPVLFNEALPLRPLRTIIALAAPRSVPAGDDAEGHRSRHSITVNRQAIQMPRSIPTIISPESNPPSAPDLGRNFGTRTVEAMDGEDQVSWLLIPGPTVMPILPKPPAKRYRASGGVEQGLLVKQSEASLSDISAAGGCAGRGDPASCYQ